jgi:hypothetical protein
MGYTTDFLGHFEITPGLNAAERKYLTAFGESRRWDRPAGPYAVPDHPVLEDVSGDRPDDREACNRPPAGQPQLYCQWRVCPLGCCLSWDGHEKFYEPTGWLECLIAHFLAPGADASHTDDPQFADFTFDHVVNGVVAACRRDTRRLWTITARDNVVREHTLVRGDDEWQSWGPFPYEVESDRWSRRRPRRSGSVGTVVRPAG